LKTLHTYVNNFQFFPKSSIYDDDARNRISEFNRHIATLYYIVRTKKLSFIPSSFRVMPDFTFLGSVIVDKAEYPVRFSTVELLYAKPELRKAFPSIQELTEYCMSKWGDLSAPNLTSRSCVIRKLLFHNDFRVISDGQFSWESIQ